MKTIPAREAKNRFGALLDAAQREPVRITKKNRPVAVVLSGEKFEAFSISELNRKAAQKRALKKLLNLPDFKEFQALSDEEIMDLVNEEIKASRQ